MGIYQSVGHLLVYWYFWLIFYLQNSKNRNYRCLCCCESVLFYYVCPRLTFLHDLSVDMIIFENLLCDFSVSKWMSSHFYCLGWWMCHQTRAHYVSCWQCTYVRSMCSTLFNAPDTVSIGRQLLLMLTVYWCVHCCALRSTDTAESRCVCLYTTKPQQ